MQVRELTFLFLSRDALMLLLCAHLISMFYFIIHTLYVLFFRHPEHSGGAAQGHQPTILPGIRECCDVPSSRAKNEDDRFCCSILVKESTQYSNRICFVVQLTLNHQVVTSIH